MTENASLYECPACGEVWRHDAGMVALKHRCDDTLHTMRELPDDGRDVEDLREATWMA